MSVHCVEISRQRSFVDLNTILARTVVPTWKSKDTRVVVHIRVTSSHRIAIPARDTRTYLRQIGVIAYLSVHGHMTGVDSRRRDDKRRGEQERQHRPCGDYQITRHTRDNSPIHSRIKRSPRGRSTRIDQRWIIDESQRDTDTALARRRRKFSTDTVIATKKIICASAINASCRLMIKRKTARSFFFSLFLTSIPLSPHSFRSTCQRYEG